MQILNNTSNTNFSGAFRIKRPYAKAKAEIPAMFTQGRQIFRDIKENGDMVANRILKCFYELYTDGKVQVDYGIACMDGSEE